MMSSHDNPPRRGTRSWSTPDPVMSRGRRYSHHSRRKKNEKDGGFNKKSQSFSPRKKRDERDERREKKKREKNRHHPITLSLITRERIILSCHRAYKIVKKKRTPHLARAVHHSEGRPRHLFFGRWWWWWWCFDACLN